MDNQIDIDTGAEAAALEAEKRGDAPEGGDDGASGETFESTASAVEALTRARKGEDDAEAAPEAEPEVEAAEEPAEEVEAEAAEGEEVEEEPAEDEETVALKAEVETTKAEVAKLSQSRQALVEDISQGFQREERMEELLYEAAEELEIAKRLLAQYNISEDPRDREIRLLKREQAKLTRRDQRGEEHKKLTEQAKAEAQKKVYVARVDGAAQAAGIATEVFRLKYLHEIQLARAEGRRPLEPETFAVSLAAPAQRVQKKAPLTLKPGRGGPVGAFPATHEGDVAFLRAARGASD